MYQLRKCNGRLNKESRRVRPAPKGDKGKIIFVSLRRYLHGKGLIFTCLTQREVTLTPPPYTHTGRNSQHPIPADRQSLICSWPPNRKFSKPPGTWNLRNSESRTFMFLRIAKQNQRRVHGHPEGRETLDNVNAQVLLFQCTRKLYPK